jgi:hypothetical protein
MVLDEIASVARRSMEFDAQFYELGNRIVLIAEDARREAVDRDFFQPFRTARQHVRRRDLILKDIERRQDMPTPAEAIAWRAHLQERYTKLSHELEHLLTLVTART